MTLKQAAEKYAGPGGESLPFTPRYPIIDAFTAGAAFERERILGLLRSDEASEYYDSLSDGASPFNGASPKEIADWLEAKLKDGDV